MKSLAVAVALTTVLAFPVYAGTAHPRHTAMVTNHAHSRAAVVRNGGIFLLENDGAGSRNQVPNFQDNWDIGY
jgi:hypothetical protein